MRAEILALDNSGWAFQIMDADAIPGQAAVTGFKALGIPGVPNRGVQRIGSANPAKILRHGEETNVQCAPPSVVRRMAPTRPTTQQTLSEGAEPSASRRVRRSFAATRMLRHPWRAR